MECTYILFIKYEFFSFFTAGYHLLSSTVTLDEVIYILCSSYSSLMGESGSSDVQPPRLEYIEYLANFAFKFIL